MGKIPKQILAERQSVEVERFGRQHSQYLDRVHVADFSGDSPINQIPIERYQEHGVEFDEKNFWRE